MNTWKKNNTICCYSCDPCNKKSFLFRDQTQHCSALTSAKWQHWPFLPLDDSELKLQRINCNINDILELTSDMTYRTTIVSMCKRMFSFAMDLLHGIMQFWVFFTHLSRLKCWFWYTILRVLIHGRRKNEIQGGANVNVSIFLKMENINMK